MLIFYTVVAEFFEFQKDRLFSMDATDNVGKEWTFVGAFHANDNVGDFVSINFPGFIIDKGLKVKDEITFTEIPQGNKPWKNFKAVVKRKIKLFGQDMWGELMV